MSLLAKLKRVLGIGPRRDRETPVSVERERPGASDDAAAAAPRGEPSIDAMDDDSASRTTSSTAPSTDEPSPAASTAASAEALTTIKGIGPAYAERLESAGIGSVAALADADADALADATDLSAKRIQGWIDRAAAQE